MKLKKCPFCGGKDISSNEVLGQRPDGVIFKQTCCVDCGACGPEVINDMCPDEAWNQRIKESDDGKC